MSSPDSSHPPYYADAQNGTADLRRLSAALGKHWARLAAATIIIGGIVYLWASSVTPVYRSEARVLIENSETAFTRPGVGQSQQDLRADFDERAVASQVQLILSRDLAREVVRALELAKLPEFDPIGNNSSGFKRLLGLFGLMRDPSQLSSEERVLEAYFKNLKVFAVQGSRVIAVEFSSEDAKLAALVANTVVEKYIGLQQGVRQSMTRNASTWLQSEIETLRDRVAVAEARVEEFRARAGLFAGSNNSTLTTQELSELNTQMVATRARQSEAQTKADLIRQVLATGKPIESLDISNAELIRRLLEQRVTLQAQRAAELRTLLPGHPRIKELNAQLENLEVQTRLETERIARAFENEAKVAQAQLDAVYARIEAQKSTVTNASGQEVELRALEREAKVQRELLEQFLGRYREADARDTLISLPPDARMISRAVEAPEPYFPKTLPMVLIAMAGALFLGMGVILTMEVLRSPYESEETHARVPMVQPSLPVRSSRQERMEAESPSSGIEAADAKIIREIAQHLVVGEPRETALRILVTTAVDEADSGRIALELARALSDSDRKCIILDAGTDSASLQGVMTSGDRDGLSDLLTGSASFTSAIHRDRDSGVHIIPAGHSTLEPKFRSRMSIVTDALGFTYDFVILLSPVHDDDGDAQALATQCGAAIIAATEPATETATVALHDRLTQAGIDDIVVLVMTPETLSRRDAA